VGPSWFRAVVSWRAPDPYWYELNASTERVVSAAGVPFFPLLPLNLSPSNVIGDQTVQNDGDVEAWPVWTVRGPYAEVRVANLTTGRTLYLTAPASAGEVLVIDTRPRRKTVIDG